MILFQQIKIDSWPVIKSFCEAKRYQPHQVLVASIVFREQHEVIIPCAVLFFSFKTGTTGYIDFTANDWLDAFFLTGFVEIDRTIHDAMVGDGQGIHAEFLRPVSDLTDLGGTVEQRIFRMDMQVDKRYFGNFHIFLGFLAHSFLLSFTGSRLRSRRSLPAVPGRVCHILYNDLQRFPGKESAGD